MPAADSLARMLARPIAHRGLHGCGGAGPIENTVPAALAAVAAGYGVECDVLFARDGTAMVIHDETLERLAGRPEAVASLDAATLGAIPLRGGGTIPTLDALLAAIAGRVTLVIEIKAVPDVRLVDDVLDCVARYAGPVVLESFDPAILARCRGAPCPVGLVGPGEDAAAPAGLARCDFLSWNVARLDGRPAALPTTSWTIRSPADAARAMAAGAQIVFEGMRP